MGSILQRLLPIVNDCMKNTQIDEEQMDTDLMELGLDSIAFIRMIVNIEDEFNIEVPDEALIPSEMNTVRKIITAIEESVPDDA